MTRSQLILKVRELVAGSSWPPKPSDYLLALIIFLIPTQLGLHFWPDSSLVYGIRLDYLSPTLYFLDLLIVVYLLLQKSLNFRFYSLFLLLLANLLFSQNPLATLSWSLHFLLYLIFCSSLSLQALRFARAPLLLALFFQLILGSTQFLLGHSVQGLLYYLGERSVSVGQPSVALATFLGQVVLRAYGTFSHPNVLAGWAVVSFLILHQLGKSSQWWRQLTTLSLLPVISLVLLTGSRAAALSLFGIIIPLSLLKTLKSRLIYYVVFTLFLFQFSFFTPPRSDLSRGERASLQGLSLQVISHYPLFGTGSQASITTYPIISRQHRLLQPDHNSLTLLLSWFGFVGIIIILYISRSALRPYSLSFLPLLPLLLFDHYLFTSPQGLLVLLLYLRATINYV